MEFVGRRVRKEFLGLGVLSGMVKSYDCGTELFEIKYENGDSEELEFSQVASSLEEKVRAADLTDTIGRKPKKRRKSPISGDSGNDFANFDCTSTGTAKSQQQELGFLDGNVDINATSSDDANKVDEKLGILKGNVDLNANCDDNGVDLNLNGGNDLNNGLDLNVPFDDAENTELCDGKSLKRGELIDLNVYVNEGDDWESKPDENNVVIPKKEHCFDLNFGVDDEMKNLNANETLVKGSNGCSETLGVNLPPSNESQHLSVCPSNASTAAGNENEGTVGSKCRINSKKRRKNLETVDSATKKILRRSARKGRVGSTDLENVSGAIGLDAVKVELASPAVSAVSEEKVTVLDCEIPPKLQLPPSSNNLNLDGIPIFDIFSVYSFLRSFSTLLFLSPFEFDDFVAAVRSMTPTLLFDYIHVSLLQTLRKHLESLSDEGSESASICLRSLNWNFLDLVTWPMFMVEYLLMHSSLSVTGFDIYRLKIFENDYYKQPSSVKIEMLQYLCDDVNEVEIIRSELNRRTLATDPSMYSDRKMILGTPQKRKTVMDISTTSCLIEDIVDDTKDWNSDECCLCKMEGSLICCDGCPAAFHSRCVGVASSFLPDGDWYCPECTIDKNNPWLRVGKSIRGAELLGTDPYNRLYYSSCGYLLVSDSGDMESSSFRYYHRNDMTVVIDAMKSSPIFNTRLLSAITKFSNLSAKVKSDIGAQTLGVSVDYTRKGKMSDIPLLPLPLAPLETCVGKPEEKSMIDYSMNGSAEISQAITGTHDLRNTRSLERRSGVSTDSRILGKPSNYVNLYSFARTASSVAEVLLRKSSNKFSEDSRKTVEDMISAQLKVLSNINSEFRWSNIWNLDVDASKENCGWCFSCKVPEDGADCLFVINDTGPLLRNFTSESLGICAKNNWKSHLVDVMCHILCIEDRLQGLLLGPWLNSDYSEIWRKAVYKASDVASLKHLLVMLESNLHVRALSADWHKLVDSATTMGSASHVVKSSLRVPSKHGISRKKARCPDLDQTQSSNAASGLVFLWWRGGRISRELFKWKVLPRSLASKAARQAGSKKIPGIVYSDSSDYAKRSKDVAWRASVEASLSVEQLAFQVRELDANIKWDAIENTKLLSKMDKEFGKSIRSFKKVIVRRKCSEGTVGKYLLDFGKRRFIPDIVVKHGCIPEESSNGRKKYWLEESYLPLHLVKSFEEKRIARKNSKMSPKKILESGRAFKKFSKKTGFSYLFKKAERSEYYQCGQCNKDVLIREAVSCQYCEGFFHKRHVRKFAQCPFTCHKCRDRTSMKTDTVKGKPKLQKGKKASEVKKSMKSKSQSQSQSNNKNSVGVPLRRSSRRIQLMSRQSEKVGGLQKNKQTTSRKGKSKKLKKLLKSKKPKEPKKCTWQKKRTFLCHSYWLNGLRLTRKSNDDRFVQFGSEKLILGSEQFNAAIGKPKCSLCCEVEFTSGLNYIGCQICGEWFHGDAFGLTAEKVGYLIGFKCHKCRDELPPVCPCIHAMTIDEGQFVRSNAAGLGCIDVVSTSISLSNEHAENGPGFSRTVACDAESGPGFSQTVACDAENGPGFSQTVACDAESGPGFGQTVVCDAESRSIPYSLDQRTEAILDCEEKN